MTRIPPAANKASSTCTVRPPISQPKARPITNGEFISKCQVPIADWCCHERDGTERGSDGSCRPFRYRFFLGVTFIKPLASGATAYGSVSAISKDGKTRLQADQTLVSNHSHRL